MSSPVGVKLVRLWPVLRVVLNVVNGDMYDKAFGEGEPLHSDVFRALTTGPAEMDYIKRNALESI